MTSAVSRHGLCKKQECFDPLLSCGSDMTAQLKHKQKGSGVSGEEEEELVMPKLQVIQNISQGSYTLTSGIYRDLGDSSD